MEENESRIIQYEEILLPKEEKEPGTPPESSSSSSSEDETMEMGQGPMPISPSEDQEKAEKLREETIDLILDCVTPPKRIERNGKVYIRRLSRQLSSRTDVVQLSKRFEDLLKERQVRMQGYCPIRRELYEWLFDELIRQSTIFCPERGVLLLRVRDEFLMTLAAYEKLFENGIEYGTRKALEAEVETQNLKIQHSQLQDEVARAEKRIRDLQAEMDAEETLSQQRVDMKKVRHEEKMEFLKRANKQLKEQLSMIT